MMTKQLSLHLFKFGVFIAMALSGGEALSMDDIPEPSKPAAARRGVASALDINKKLDKELFGTKAQDFKDGRLFTGIMKMADAHPGTFRNKNYDGKGLHFAADQKYNKKSFYPDRKFDSSLRLDIEGDAKEGKYVNIQYQQGSNLGATLASAVVKKGCSFRPEHILLCLLGSASKREENQNPPTISSDTHFSKKVTASVKRRKKNTE